MFKIKILNITRITYQWWENLFQILRLCWYSLKKKFGMKSNFSNRDREMGVIPDFILLVYFPNLEIMFT